MARWWYNGVGFGGVMGSGCGGVISVFWWYNFGCPESEFLFEVMGSKCVVCCFVCLCC